MASESILCRNTICWNCRYTYFKVYLFAQRIFEHSFLQNTSDSENGWTVWRVKFKSHHKFSIRFCSGIYLGHSNTGTCFDLNNSIIVLFRVAKVNLCLSVVSFAASNRVSSRIALHIAPSFWSLFKKKSECAQSEVHNYLFKDNSPVDRFSHLNYIPL